MTPLRAHFPSPDLPAPPAATPAERPDHVTVWAAGQLFAIELAHVRDVFEPGPITPVPLGPAGVAGLLHTRGRVLTAIDLRARLGHAPARGCATKAVGLQHEGERFCLLVDDVAAVLALDPADADHAILAGDGWSDVAQGIREANGVLVVVLDIAALLDPSPTRPNHRDPS